MVQTARTARRLGRHVQLFASLATIAELAPVLSRLPVPLVIDHMGLAKDPAGPQFEALLDLVRGGHLGEAVGGPTASTGWTAIPWGGRPGRPAR
ncbi:MAG: hypothetical protein QM757_46150 [Paludibaculum sp.]